MPFEAEVGFLPEDTYTFSPEEKRPKLVIRRGGSGIFLMLEDDSVIIGEKYFYFYDADMIYRSPAGMKETVGEFLNFCTARPEDRLISLQMSLPCSAATCFHY